MEAKAAKKTAAQEEERQKKQQKLERGSVPLEQLFKPPNVPEGVYGSWDDQGMPLTDGEGNELSKNQMKKIRNMRAAHGKLHEQYLAWKKESR